MENSDNMLKIIKNKIKKILESKPKLKQLVIKIKPRRVIFYIRSRFLLGVDTAGKQKNGLRINIVTVDSGWILQKIAERIAIALKKQDIDVHLSLSPKQNCDANFYIDVSNCFLRKSSTFDIGCFTHLDKNSIDSLNPIWLHLDFIIHQSKRYLDAFAEFYPIERMVVVRPGQIEKSFQKIRKVKIGIVQRGEHVGKGREFMLNLFNENDYLIKKWLHFIFVGKGWKPVVDYYKKIGIEVDFFDNENYKNYIQYYQKFDFLLIPSLWEGGPMSVIEAYSQSMPIISSRVGWVDEISIDNLLFEPGDKESLLKILKNIIEPREKRRLVAENFSYDKFSSELIKIINDLKNRKQNGKKYFQLETKKYQYFYNGKYNGTWQNERAVEIPIIINKVEEYKDKKDVKILEIGNVLSNYFSFPHDIIDKYERSKNIINKDIINYYPKNKYDLIVSISTFEHIGIDEEKKEINKILLVINHIIKNCLNQNGELIFTVPSDYNPTLDMFIKDNKLNLNKILFLKRISYDNEWIQTDEKNYLNTKYNQPFPWANALAICFKKLL